MPSGAGCRGFTGPVPSASLDASGTVPAPLAWKYNQAMELRQLVEEEALAARRALPKLTDERVSSALRAAAVLVRERREEILAANRADVEAATGRSEERRVGKECRL